MKQPTLVIPHGGGPCFFMDPDGGPPDPMWRLMQAYLATLIGSLPERPRAILIVSGTARVTLPHARFAHPEAEHLFSLMAALCTGGDDRAICDYRDTVLGWVVSGCRFG